MSKHETASANIRIYPSDKTRLQALADKKKETEPGNTTPADVVHDLLNVSDVLCGPAKQKAIEYPPGSYVPKKHRTIITMSSKKEGHK